MRFQVRIVFFESSLTHTNRAYQAKLGIETYFDGPIMTPSFIQLSGASRHCLDAAV